MSGHNHQKQIIGVCPVTVEGRLDDITPEDAIRLKYPVHTLDTQFLLPAGSVLSARTLEDLISSNKSTSCSTYPLLEYGMVKYDLLRQMSRPPYDF